MKERRSEPFQQRLFDELKSRIKETDESVPYFKNGYYYYTRTLEGQQYYKYCRKKGSLDAPEEILLDVDAMAKGYAYYAVGGLSVSPDNKLLAYGVGYSVTCEFVVHIKNLETGKIMSDRISRTSGGTIWANDNKTLFYTAKNPVTLLSEKIKRHTLGTDEKNDVTVYHEKDNTNYIGVTAQLIDVLYSVTALEDRFLIVTNDNAKNFKVMECPLDKTGKENWKEMIPHRADVLVSDIDEFKDFLVISERKNGLTQLAVRNLKDEGWSTRAAAGMLMVPMDISMDPSFLLPEGARKWDASGTKTVKLMKKKNTFTDFIDCGQYLDRSASILAKVHLYAKGGSAGGLLMGAVVNMAPDLWKGCNCECSFVDVVNTMLDETIPLTTNEYDEWGNPNTKACI
ncbi:hypothetical protein FQR65_LT17653 [Abscondita terminalis]|nr:hypothetical protein FQR65_LT17653 [Abscondita terminalis]